MRKIIFILVLMIIVTLGYTNKLVAQNLLLFCDGVDSTGSAVNPRNEFYIDNDSIVLYFYVNLINAKVGCTHIDYKLYDVEENGQQNWDTSIPQDGLSEGWSKFWRKIEFYKAGTYHVYVYDCKSNLLTADRIKIIQKKKDDPKDKIKN